MRLGLHTTLRQRDDEPRWQFRQRLQAEKRLLALVAQQAAEIRRRDKQRASRANRDTSAKG